MKILFLTDEFYPIFGANSLVVNTLCEQFVQDGHEAVVMPSCYDKSLPEEETYRDIKIIRKIPADTKQNLKTNFNKERFIDSAKVLFNLIKTKLNKKVRVRVNSRIFARKFLREWIDENGINAVISINCSIELSFPLLYLRKRKQLNCKWIFYMIDPFESHEYYRSISAVKKLREIQHEIMEKCDGIVATDLIYKDTAEWESKEILKKITVLGFPKIVEPHYVSCDDDIEMDKSKINIVCTGSKNEKERNSDYTMQICKSLADRNIIFHFVGIGWTTEDKVIDHVCYYRKRSYQAVLNLQQNADFLLNIGNKSSNQLPSKILEYISTGKPIINIYKNENCPTLNLLKGYDALNVFEKLPIYVAKQVVLDYIYLKREKCLFESIEKEYYQYTAKFVARNMLQVIKA